MFPKKDWPKVLAIIIFIVLTGGYYDQLSVETKARVLPLGIFLIGGYVIARFKQLEYGVRASNVATFKLVAQEFSLVDTDGNERVGISTSSDSTAMRFYDQTHDSRATLELIDGDPLFKLEGQSGSVVLTFDRDGKPCLEFRGEDETITWSAP